MFSITGATVISDDKVEENHLATAFDLTYRAWKNRFHVPYMYCGCPLPGETIGQKIKRMSKNYRLQHDFLRPPENEVLAATHPSDKARERRTAKQEARRQRDAKYLERGKMDRAAYERGAQHDSAFIYPVPMYFYDDPGAHLEVHVVLEGFLVLPDVAEAVVEVAVEVEAAAAGEVEAEVEEEAAAEVEAEVEAAAGAEVVVADAAVGEAIDITA
ncbi:hypothetical protein PLICRDRAFT_697162 [Plicaturopsis crispa FD-325 SS-3]|nr:hypothetical protein PLICRDRAFT_697162 [Plicaturopsis crispa FD-325 SS-3]